MSPAIRPGKPLSEKSTSVVDANVIVSLLIGHDREHFEQSRVFFESVREGGSSAYIASAVIAECIYLLTRIYGVSRDDVATRLIGLLDYRGVRVESPAVRRALTMYGTHKVDFVDALIAATAREEGWAVFSFDRDLVRLAK
jgi:predicted nucleic-acid-binding protein